MAKIGIYIPDAKAGEVEEWKAKLNLSEIFREAFDRAVRKAQLSEMGDDEMENLVKKLRQDQDASFQAGKDGAFEAGVDWAKGPPKLSDLRRVCDSEDWEMDEFMSLLSEYGDWDLEDDCARGEHDWESYAAGFMEGFIEGAQSIWDQVRNQL